jgi:hypothetical protein
MDKYEEQARVFLPCAAHCGCGDDGSPDSWWGHTYDCPGYHRKAVATALRQQGEETRKLRERLDLKGHGKPCYYCGKPCNDLAGNPGLWSIPGCHTDDPGRVKWHHIQCVFPFVDEARAALSGETSS